MVRMIPSAGVNRGAAVAEVMAVIVDDGAAVG
jgi:hypothetical protein